MTPYSDSSRFHNFKKKSDSFFVFLVLFEIVTHYPYIDSSHWLRKDVQWIIDKVFRGKICFKWFPNVLLAFLIFFKFCLSFLLFL